MNFSRLKVNFKESNLYGINVNEDLLGQMAHGHNIPATEDELLAKTWCKIIPLKNATFVGKSSTKGYQRSCTWEREVFLKNQPQFLVQSTSWEMKLFGTYFWSVKKGHEFGIWYTLGWILSTRYELVGLETHYGFGWYRHVQKRKEMGAALSIPYSFLKL